MFDKPTFIISDYHIAGTADRLSTEGKVLRSVWIKGPSKATLDHGSVSDVKFILHQSKKKSDNVEDSQDKPDTNSSDTSDSGESAQGGSGSNNGNTEEGFTRTYSIYEAFKKYKYVCEDSPDGGDGGSDSGTPDAGSNDNPPPPEQPKPKVKHAVSDRRFLEGYKLRFKVGINGEGWTEWIVAVDKRANIKEIIDLIKKMKFKEAFDKAGSKSDIDGIIPMSAVTRVYKEVASENKVEPPFIGYCGYGFGAGNFRDTGDDVTLTLAMAPFNMVDNKKSEETVIKAVYNIKNISAIEPSGLDKLADAGKDIAGHAGKVMVGKDGERPNDSGAFTDGNPSGLVDSLNNHFKAMFGDIEGNSTADVDSYEAFMKIRKYIREQLNAKNIEMHSVTVGNDKNSVPLNKDNISVYNKKFVCY